MHIDTTQQERASVIAGRNDEFRKSGLGIIVTNGVKWLENTDAVLEIVRDYDRFSEDNDPYQEHDFGLFEYAGESLGWKIDYYDQRLQGYTDPLSQECRRILTVFLSSEY